MTYATYSTYNVCVCVCVCVCVYQTVQRWEADIAMQMDDGAARAAKMCNKMPEAEFKL